MAGTHAKPPLNVLGDLPREVWTNFILPACGASELIRLLRVSQASERYVIHALAGSATLRAIITTERNRRAASRTADRAKRMRDRRYDRSPPIVQAALDGNIAAVTALLDSGVDVDVCATWVESEWKMGGYDKEWTWKMDTALTMACSIGHLPLIQLLLDRGANPQHSVCNEADVHYGGAWIARKNGHLLAADYMDRIIDAIEAPRRAARLQQARESSMEIRAEACRLREAGPPYIPTPPAHRDSAGGVHPQYFATAAKDFKYGLGYDEHRTYIPGRSYYFPESEIPARRASGELRDPSGEEVSQKESVSFAILALEVLKTQPQFLPSQYGPLCGCVVTEMIELLGAIPEQAAEHAAASEAISAWQVHEVAERERLELLAQRRMEEERQRREAKMEEERQRLEAKQQRRNLEVERCRRIWPSKGWQSACTDDRCGYSQDKMDRCTWGHAYHDLPPRCRWGADCTHGDRCRYNHWFG